MSPYDKMSPYDNLNLFDEPIADSELLCVCCGLYLYPEEISNSPLCEYCLHQGCTLDGNGPGKECEENQKWVNEHLG